MHRETYRECLEFALRRKQPSEGALAEEKIGAVCALEESVALII